MLVLVGMCFFEFLESCDFERLFFFLKFISYLYNYAFYLYISGRDSLFGGWILLVRGSKRKRCERRGFFWGNAWKGRRVFEKW